MILTCPSCDTRFQIPDGALGEAGRRVKCSACRHVWFQAPENAPDTVSVEDEAQEIPPRPGFQTESDALPERADNVRPILPGAPTPAPEMPTPEADQPTIAAGEDETADSSGIVDDQQSASEEDQDDQVEIVESTSSDQVSDDISSFNVPRVVAVEPVPTSRGFGWRGTGLLLLVIVVAAALWALYQWRGDVMQAVPQVIPAYFAAGLITPPSSRNLSLEDVAFEVRDEAGDRVLIVSGLVVNAGADLSQLPKLRAELLDQDGQVTTFWTFPATDRVLAPGEQTGFRDIYPDPPVTGQETDIFVTFEDLR